MDATPVSGQCLDAETVAAMADGGLSADEQSAAAEHALTCARCRELIVSVVRTTPEPTPQPSGWRTWWQVPSLRWLAPVVATGLAVAVWVAVDSRHPNVTSLTVPLRAPEKREAVVVPSPQEREAKADAAPARKALGEPKTEPPKEEAAQEKATATGQAFRSDAPADRQAALQRDRSKTGPVDQLAAAKPEEKQPKAEALDKRVTATPPPAQASPASPPPAASPAPPATTSNEAGRGGRRDAGVSGGAGTLARTEAFTDRAAVGAIAETVAVAIPDIASPDARSRWRISGASVQRSTDNGETWTAQKTGTTVRLTAGSAPHPDICWIVGDQGTVLVSVDGRSWQRVKSPDAMRLVSVTATSADAATVTTSDGRTFATTDRGRTWEVR